MLIERLETGKLTKMDAARCRRTVRLCLWFAGAVACFVVAWYFVLAHPTEAVDNRGIPIETAIGGETRIPADQPNMLRTAATYVYYQHAAPYFDITGNPAVIEVQLDTTAHGGTIRLALTNLIDDQCLVDAVPYVEERVGASVNYVPVSNSVEHGMVHFDKLGSENRIDENSFRAIHRTWWVTDLDLSKPHKRYLVACAVDAQPDWESAVERHILFEGPRASAVKFFRPLPDGNYIDPGADDTIGLVRFLLADAQDVTYEGAAAATPNSEAAHRFRVSYSHGSVNAHWIDVVASRRHDLWLFLGGVIAALGMTILFELLKLLFPFEERGADHGVHS